MEICSNYNHAFEDTDYPSSEKQKPCPKCGSTTRTTSVVLGSLTLSATATVLASAPVLSFGTIVTFERDAPDGQVVRLMNPFYSYLIETIKKDPEVIYQIDPRKWEEIIAAAYDNAGFDEVILTPRSGDLGRDVIAIKRGFGAVKFIEQVKAYKPGHLVTADEVRALLGVLSAERDASKAIFSTTSSFAPRIEQDRLLQPFLPYRLELVDREKLLKRLTISNQ